MRTADFRSVVRTDGLASADAVGAFMNNLRIWLDHLHVEPADFVPVGSATGTSPSTFIFDRRNRRPCSGMPSVSGR